MARQSPALEALANFKFAGTTPFPFISADLADDVMEEAYSLLIVINNAIAEGGDELSLRTVHLNAALAGVMTLLSLSAFAREHITEDR
jgi:hypothetical protein